MSILKSLWHLFLSREVESSRTRYNCFGVEKVGIEKDSSEMHNRLERASLISKEDHLHGSSTKLVRKMKYLKNRLRKIEDDVYQSELEEEIVFIVV